MVERERERERESELSVFCVFSSCFRGLVRNLVVSFSCSLFKNVTL